MRSIRSVLLLTLLACFGVFAHAQKIELPDGSVFIEKQSQNVYKKEVNNYTYRFDDDGAVWVTDSNARTFQAATIKHGDAGRIFFYDKVSGEYMGSYEPSTSSFVLPKGNIVATYATGTTLADHAGNVLYTLIGAINNEVLGFFIYFRY